MEERLAIFCDANDFCQKYEDYCIHYRLVSKDEIISRTKMYMSEIITIVIYFYLSYYRIFK